MARRNTTPVSWSCEVCRRRRPWWGRNPIHRALVPTVLAPHLSLSIGKGNTSKLTSICIHNQRQTKQINTMYKLSCLHLTFSFKSLHICRLFACVSFYLFIKPWTIILSSILKTPLFCNLIFLMMILCFLQKTISVVLLADQVTM